MNRQRPDLLEAYLEFVKNTESPASYHTWACLSMISSALERRCSMTWGHTQLFPNQYIVIVGPSGARKGEPLIITNDLMKSIGINLASQSVTREALIRTLSDSIRTFDLDGSMHFQCPLTIVAEELAVFLGGGDPKFLADLTNWYDSRTEWTYQTKHEGTDEISGVCVNILASTAPDWIPLTIPPQAIGGGFTSRILFVVEFRKGHDVADPNAIPIDEKLRDALKHDLEVIRSLRGEFVLEPDALEIYKDWYLKEENRNRAGRPIIADPKFSGYVSRRASHVKKVAMACSASRSNSLRITRLDLLRAMKLLEKIEAHMPSVFGKIGLSLYADQTQSVLSFIREAEMVPKHEVMQMFYRDVDTRTMEIIESTLKAARFIKASMDDKGDVMYHWVG